MSRLNADDLEKIVGAIPKSGAMAEEKSYPLGGKDGRPDLRDVEEILRSALSGQPGGLLDGAAYEARVLGPMAGVHFGGGDNLRSVYPGGGAELAILPGGGPGGVSIGGQYQRSDSNGNPSWWAGATPFYRMGNPDGFWAEPGLLAGMIQKEGYNGGEVGPLAVPRLNLGWKNLMLGLGYVPAAGGMPAVGVGQLGGRWEF